MRKKPRARNTGAKRMSALGYKPIQVWVDADQHKLLSQAAKMFGRPLANFVKWSALQNVIRPIS